MGSDLLFIDTFHNYCQLKAELLKHEAKVSKYIILHDTSLYADKSDYDDLMKQFQLYISPNEFDRWKAVYFGACTNKADGKRGIWAAVEEFLQKFKQWKLHE